MSTMPIETYNKLKTEYLSYRSKPYSYYSTLLEDQSEETLKEYQKAIKLLRESNDALKRENHKTKIEQSTKDQSKEIKKLKEDKLVLSRKLMDLESEAIAYKDKPLDMLLSENNTSESFAFSLNSNTTANKQVIKDKLKNKNEEILILKNELVKKDKAMIQLIKKHRESDQYANMLKPNKKINEAPLYRNKSDNDFVKTVILKQNRKYFDSMAHQQKRILKGAGNNNANRLMIKKGGDANNKQSGTDVRNTMNKKRLEELNISLENEYDDDGHSTLEKNISLEIKNILEEKRNFIIQTMTYENFSFDIMSALKPAANKPAINTSMTSSTSNNNNTNNHQQQQQIRINKDIDAMIEKIKKRKGVVDTQRSKLENMINQYEISIN